DPDHADAVAYAAAPERFREGRKPGIAGHAANVLGVLGTRRVADDVDDDAAAARFHERIEGAGHVDGAEHFQIPGHAPPRLVARKQGPAGDRAGVVDKYVHRRELRGQPRHVGAVRQIGGVGADGDLVFSFKLLAGGVEIGGAARDQHKTATLRGQSLADGTSDAAGTAGDER